MIDLYMPVMRPDSAELVIQDLAAQSFNIDRLVIVDNDNCFEKQAMQFKNKVPFEIEYLNYGYNLGVNAVWNMIFDSQCGYTGLIGDDYRLDPNLILILLKGFSRYPEAGCTTATIFQNMAFIPGNPRIVHGKAIKANTTNY